MPNTQIWAHSTIRTNPRTHRLGIRTRLYRHPSFSTSGKAKNRISPGSSRQATAVYSYHRAQFGHRTASFALTAVGVGTPVVPIVRGMIARRGLRPTGTRRSFFPVGKVRYSQRSHGTSPVVRHPLNHHLRANHASSVLTRHGGRKNVRVRRGAHGHFAGSY